MKFIRFKDDLEKLSPKKNSTVYTNGLTLSSLAYAVSQNMPRAKSSYAVLVPTSLEAEDFIGDLSYFWPQGLKENRILNLPALNNRPFVGQPESRELLAQRLWALYSLAVSSKAVVVVISADSALGLNAPAKFLTNHVEYLVKNEETDLEKVRNFLTSSGYLSTGLVEAVGDFSSRGGILDVFSPGAKSPARIEFFGDFIESLRLFEPHNQRSTQNINELVLISNSETVYLPGLAEKVAEKIIVRAKQNNWHQLLWGPLVERIKSEQFFSDLASYAPLFYNKLDSIFSYLNNKAKIIVYEPQEINFAAEKAWIGLTNHFDRLSLEKRPHLPLNDLYLPFAKILKEAKNPFWYSQKQMGFREIEKEESSKFYSISVELNSDLKTVMSSPRVTSKGFLEPVVAKCKNYLKRGLNINIVLHTKEQVKRLAELLLDYDLSTEKSEKNSVLGSLEFSVGQLSAGFVLIDYNIAFISEEEVFGSKRRLHRKSLAELKGLPLAGLKDLVLGDFIVHVEHGIGQYSGLVNLNISGAIGDFLFLKYKGEDKLYVPVERFNALSKYVGGTGRAPALDRLGGYTWERLKDRVKENIKEMAEDLLKLYAERELKPGIAYDSSNSAYKEFETAFEFEETPDQMKAIKQVLKDLAKPVPMDRLICGDVGYGKTEVAMRAAFKVVADNKQVAVLAPTTILVEQHAHTFSERFKDWPVKIESISRFKTPAEQKEVLKRLKNGGIDIIVGTHRLLQKDVHFHDLGLLVVDEEHRFGVQAKERLKKARTEVDILATSATPIPRSLSMALNGIRDLSIINTPPQDRLAVQTRLLKYEDEILCEAIDRELIRGGQVFLIHNRVNSIYKLSETLRSLMPLVRFEVGHGQLKSAELEEIMIKFARKEIDVLLATTIVESGLDFPNANTIIINQADMFGLAQLYQLRGRVGRGHKQAYAYLLVDNPDTLTGDASKRLKAILDNTGLGSGYQIALHDLQIRGGGNILGASQSGQASLVGYEMYIQLMEEAIKELKGEKVEEKIEPEVILGWPAYLPTDYAPDTQSRLDLYQKISQAKNETELKEIEAEIGDRFGAFPFEVENLLALMNIKLSLKKAKIKRLEAGRNGLTLSFAEKGPINPKKLIEYITDKKGDVKLHPDGRLFVKNLSLKGPANLADLNAFLENIN